jgi:hypothetical protein
MSIEDMNMIPIDVWVRKYPSCYTCQYWERDLTLLGDYAYNSCGKDEHLHITSSYHWCPKYLAGAITKRGVIIPTEDESPETMLDWFAGPSYESAFTPNILR